MNTKLPELRKQRKLSQEELAAAVGVTRQTITSIECGKYTASLVLAYKLARYFDASIEEIFDFSDLSFTDTGSSEFGSSELGSSELGSSYRKGE